MKIPHKRKRDNQQWLLDWVVNQSGRVINYEYEERELPDNVKTYAQVPKALGRRADYKASIAEKARLIAILAWDKPKCLKSSLTCQKAV